MMKPMVKVREPDALLVEEREPNPINQDLPFRGSHKAHRIAITNDYMVYLKEHEFDVNEDIDPTNFQETITSPNYLE